MGQDNLKFIFLCCIFSAVINLSVAAFSRIFSRNKNFNHLIFYWVQFFLVFVYSFLFFETPFQIAFSFYLTTIGVNLLAKILGNSQGRQKSWYFPFSYQLPVFVISTFLLLKTDVGFTMAMIPASLAMGVPLFHEAYLTLLKNRKYSNWAEKAMAILFVVFGLHNMDYPFLRMNPAALSWGYSFSLVILQCVSLFVPLVINLRREEQERKNISLALDQISGKDQPVSLEIEELYQNLTLQISQKEALFKELSESNSVLAEEKLVNELLIRTITHDLSSPITNISNYCDFLRSGKIDENDVDHVWDRVQFNTQTALAKIQNTKIALRTRAIASGIELENVSVKNALSKLSSLFEGQLKKKDLKVEMTSAFSEDVCIEASEAALIEHVLSHVFSNAIKYSVCGNKILISCFSSSDTNLTLEFRDFGVGFPNSAYEKSILSSSPGTEGEPGNGFGIMIMGYFMRRFGGTYSFKIPENGPGAVVVLKFRKISSTFGATTKPLAATFES